MSEPTTSMDERWGVPVKRALLLAGGFFGLLVLSLAGVWLFYRAEANDPRALRPHPDPAPALRTYQRRPDEHLPGHIYAPPQDTAGQDRAIRGAMQALAARGDAGWAPLAPPPNQPPAASQGVAPEQAFPLSGAPSANPVAAPASGGTAR